MGRARAAAVVMIVALVTLPGCTGPDGDRAGPTSAPSVLSDPGPVSTISATVPPSHPTTSAATLPGRSTSSEAVSPEPIQISYPAETYTEPVYIVCGQQFGPSLASGLPTYVTQDAAAANPDFRVLPSVLTDVNYAFDVVFGSDCAHGGSVEVSPGSSATMRPLAASTTGTLVAAEVLHTKGATTVVTIRPDDGSTPTVVTVHWQR